MRRAMRTPRDAGRGKLALILALVAPLALGSVCEGTGSSRPGSITQEPIDPRCTPIGGPFPAGFDWLPGAGETVVAMRFSPAGLLRYDASVAPPLPDNAGPVPALPADSDGDGLDDAAAYRAAGLCPSTNPACLTTPVPGSVHAAFGDVALVTTSGYEQVLFYDARDGRLAGLEVGNPSDAGAHHAADRPLLPAAGSFASRTGLSTTACAYPPTPVDSAGAGIAPSPHCDPTRIGFLTRFTAATAVSAGRLFVATSNLFSSSQAAFHPGTVLVHDVTVDAAGRPTRVAPNTSAPVLFTSAFNPTGLTAHRTPGGRDVVLVTLTGAIDGAGDLLGDSALDVIDVAGLRVVATVPLGRAGASFGRVAIDPGGYVAVLGAESAPHVYAVDLASLDDPALYAPRPSPVVLDGSTPGFADARIFHAGAPLALPRRADGPPEVLCRTRVNVGANAAGDRVYATDWCDGSLSTVRIDWTQPLERPVSPARFRVAERLDWFAPKWPANFGQPSAPSGPLTRPGRPGVDFDGPDLFFLINEPEGQLCAARVEP